jgi:hypothetical protein
VVVDASGNVLFLQVMVQLLLQLQHQHRLDYHRFRRQLLPEQLFQWSMPVLPARPSLILFLEIMVETVEHQKMMDLMTATMMSCAQKQ